MSKKTADDLFEGTHFPSDLLADMSVQFDDGPDFENPQFGMGDINISFGEGGQEDSWFDLNGESAENLDLTGMLTEASELNDLEWLDPSQLQDPESLPHTPESIPELEEAWADNKPSPNIYASDTVDLDRARYAASLKEGHKAPSRIDKKNLQGVIASVMRRSAAGQDVDTAIKTALESCGEEMGRIAPALRAVRAEHGLAGNVFIRASAYPNLASGKWTELLKKTASGARYIIVSSEELTGSTWIKDGHCQVTGKRAVTEVPWAAAVAYYGPRLAGTGRKMASGGNPVEALRQAFLSAPHKEALETEFPTHLTPSQRISAEAARAALKAHVPVKIVSDPTAARLARELPLVESRLQQMVAARLLTEDQKSTILASGAEPHDMLRTAGSLASKSNKKGAFNGSPNEARRATADAAVLRAEASAQRTAVQASKVQDPESIRTAHNMERVRAKVAGMVSSALLTELQASQVLASGGSPLDILTRAGALAAHSTKAREFNGTQNTAVLPTAHAAMARAEVSAARRDAKVAQLAAHEEAVEGQRLAKALDHVKLLVSKGLRGARLASEIKRRLSPVDIHHNLRGIRAYLAETGALKEVKASEYQGAVFHQAAAGVPRAAGWSSTTAETIVKWARRTMSEGMAGRELTQIINARFASEALAEAEAELKEARSMHEGGSGFLYVDAEAYASPTGVKGCEAAASKHVSNSIPAVAAMPRCGSCTLAHRLEDGSRRCSVFHKTLIGSRDITSAEVVRSKKANIKAADATDFSVTSSIFAPAYDPSEFGLEAPTMESIELSETEKLSELLFGGWNIG